jgi:hypothetical protein
MEILRAKRSFEPQNRENLNRKKLQIREEIPRKNAKRKSVLEKVGKKNFRGSLKTRFLCTKKSSRENRKKILRYYAEVPIPCAVLRELRRWP